MEPRAGDQASGSSGDGDSWPALDAARQAAASVPLEELCAKVYGSNVELLPELAQMVQHLEEKRRRAERLKPHLLSDGGRKLAWQLALHERLVEQQREQQRAAQQPEQPPPPQRQRGQQPQAVPLPSPLQGPPASLLLPPLWPAGLVGVVPQVR